MADAFSVDPAAIEDAAERMGDFVRYAESVVAEIDTLVTNLHVTWSGEAAAAHAEAHRLWARGEANMREALARLTAAGNAAHNNYTGAMHANTNMWS